MKPGTVFIVIFAVTVALGVLLLESSKGAEPMDVFMTPVPAAPEGTSAAILPPGTYHAVTANGVRLSGWVHSPCTSRLPMLKKAPSASPKSKMPQHVPHLRFVPVPPQFPTLVRP
jgi:hypothetical protein